MRAESEVVVTERPGEFREAFRDDGLELVVPQRIEVWIELLTFSLTAARKKSNSAGDSNAALRRAAFLSTMVGLTMPPKNLFTRSRILAFSIAAFSMSDQSFAIGSSRTMSLGTSTMGTDRPDAVANAGS